MNWRRRESAWSDEAEADIPATYLVGSIGAIDSDDIIVVAVATITEEILAGSGGEFLVDNHRRSDGVSWRCRVGEGLTFKVRMAERSDHSLVEWAMDPISKAEGMM